MANQPTTGRPWFRLTSIARQPAPQVPAAQPAPPPQPRPPIARLLFRPVAQPQPAQTEPTAPPPAAAPQPPAPRAPASPAAPTAPTPSVPTSPAPRAAAPSSSVPASPAPTTSKVALPVTTTSSVPSSPKPGVSPSTSSVPSPPASKPATTSTSVPSSPAIRVATVSSLPTSPSPKPADSKPSSPAPKTTIPTTVTARVPSPAQPSPRTLKPAIETPPQSPKPRPTAPPPSPLTLPPSQIKANAERESKIPPEAEQKDVLVQKTIEKANGDTQKPSTGHTGKQGVAKEANTKGKAHRKKFSSSDTEEEGVRVITLAGENKGAIMEVMKSPKENGSESTSSYRLYKKGNHRGISSDGSSEFQSYSSSSGENEGNPDMKKDKKNRAMSIKPTLMSAFTNSNVQGVNNSIVFKSSCTHHDPGVHLGLSRKPSNDGFHVKGRRNGYDS